MTPTGTRTSKLPKTDTLPCVAVTGGTGFVGRSLIQTLLVAGNPVKALVRPQSLAKAQALQARFEMAYLSAHGQDLPPNQLQWITGNLDDAQLGDDLFDDADVVLHLAGLITAKNRDEYVAANGTSITTLAKSAREQGVKRFIYLSSLTAREPDLSDYGYSKRVGELALQAVCADQNFDTDMHSLCVRAPAVFGAEDVATAPIFACIRAGFLPAPGGRGWRTRKIGLVHVDDLTAYLAGACLYMGLEDKARTSAENITTIATRASLTWPDFAEQCSHALGRKIRVVPLPLSLLYPVAAITSVSKHLFGKGHLTLGKLKEFLHDDWSVSVSNQSEADFLAAIARTVYPDKP